MNSFLARTQAEAAELEVCLTPGLTPAAGSPPAVPSTLHTVTLLILTTLQVPLLLPPFYKQKTEGQSLPKVTDEWAAGWGMNPGSVALEVMVLIIKIHPLLDENLPRYVLDFSVFTAPYLSDGH